MTKGLKLAEPPRRRADTPPPAQAEPPAPTASTGRIHKKAAAAGHAAAGQGEQTPKAAPVPVEKFDQLSPTAKVQFNKRITREVADGYEILAIRTRRRVPDLLAEALEMLEERYGRT